MDSLHGIPPNFEWNEECEMIMKQIATDDSIHVEWDKLRDMIKYKIEKNITIFLADSEQLKNIEPPRPHSPIDLPSGGLKLAPFPPRKPSELNQNDPPKVFMTEAEANEMKNFIFQQLHEFEEQPPFTIQRVCELCTHPKDHYKVIGKYLRAVEKALLVTSTWNAFPKDKDQSNIMNISSVALPGDRHTAPMTPLFSPIPFLHGDARRSQSRSPPPSPLTLAALDASGPVEPLPDEMQQKAIGLVDELDDPSPGHMSDHPTALTSVTTVISKPFLDSLETRFVKAQEGKSEDSQKKDDEEMSVDSAEDKENKG